MTGIRFASFVPSAFAVFRGKSSMHIELEERRLTVEERIGYDLRVTSFGKNYAELRLLNSR